MHVHFLLFKSKSADIITDISAKYASDNQWIKYEISNLANLYYVI